MRSKTKLITIEYDEYLDLLKYKTRQKSSHYEQIIKDLIKIQVDNEDIDRFIKILIQSYRIKLNDLEQKED